MAAKVLARLLVALGMGCMLLPIFVPAQGRLPDAVPHDKSLVVFIQGKEYIYGGLYQGTTMLVGADKNSWGYALLTPGKHRIWGCGPEREMDFVAGATHYIYCELLMSTLPEEEASAFLAELPGPTSGKPVKKPDRAYEFSAKWAQRFEWQAAPEVASAPQPQIVEGSVRVPAGTPVDFELAEMVTSAHSPLGGQVWLRVAEDSVADGHMWLPAGSVARGVLPQVKRRSGPAIGSFELVVPSVDVGGVRVPLVGQFFSAARHRAKAAKTAMLLGGPLAVLMVGGNNAFELPGTRVRLWTRENIWIPRVSATAASEAAAPLQPTTLPARSPTQIKFSPQGDAVPVAIAFEIDGSVAVTEAVLAAVGGKVLPEQPKATQIAQRPTGSVATFDGWSVLRFTGVSPEPIRVRLKGSLADGRSFVAEASVTAAP